MKKEKTTMIKEDELKQIYGGCIEEPSLKTGPLTRHYKIFCVNGKYGIQV